jgi:hypothetical protein
MWLCSSDIMTLETAREVSGRTQAHARRKFRGLRVRELRLANQ